MFTGIVELIGTVRSVIDQGPGKRIVVQAGWPDDDIAIGDSVAVNGVCLTVVERTNDQFAFELGPETLARTNLGQIAAGGGVNLERSLLPTTRIGGHFVLGHVDGVAHVSARRPEQDWEWFDFTCSREWTDQMVPKGSVAVDGVSLTLVHVSPGSFGVMLIPHTLERTILKDRRVGAVVNIETDILGKYILQAASRIRMG